MTGCNNLLSHWDILNKMRGRKIKFEPCVAPMCIMTLSSVLKSAYQNAKKSWALTPYYFLFLVWSIRYFPSNFQLCLLSFNYPIPILPTPYLPPPCSPNRVLPTRIGTPQRTTRSLWRTWTSWVDRRSCKQRLNWPWLWPSPWPRCRWRLKNRTAKSHQWLTWSVPEIWGCLFSCLFIYFLFLCVTHTIFDLSQVILNGLAWRSGD